MEQVAELAGDLWQRYEIVCQNIESIQAKLAKDGLPSDKRECLEYQLGVAQRGRDRIGNEMRLRLS